MGPKVEIKGITVSQQIKIYPAGFKTSLVIDSFWISFPWHEWILDGKVIIFKKNKQNTK